MCVYDFLKENDFAPFPRHHIQAFARQLLKSVACKSFLSLSFIILITMTLVLHDLHLIHTDLKPENILLVKNDYSTVSIPVPGKVSVFSATAVERLVDKSS
jgi:dual-specificity kinase